MSELAALRAAVYAAPDDDATRLVLADYLIEHGDPRGELVHVQIALLRPNHPGAQKLHDRAYALIAKLGRPPNGVEVRYERGFAFASVEAWHANEDALGFLRDEPLLESLTITDCNRGRRDYWDNLAQLIEPLLDRIRGLRVEDLESIADYRACGAMFEALPPRPATLVDLDVPPGVPLPTSWRR